MIKKALIIIIVIFIITSCDILISFWVSPVYNIPVSRSGWTVDMANSRIIGDSEYFEDQGWSLNWIPGNNTLLFRDYYDDNINVSTLGFPLEMSKYSKVNSPLFYLNLLFKHDFGGFGVDLDLVGPTPVPLENIDLNRNGEDNVDYTMDVNTSGGIIPSYTLPEPAYLGIDGDGTTTELTGSLYTVDFDIYANGHDFVAGHATCVFSYSNPAGLLYMVYYHDGGLVSLIYANDVETTASGNLFPDGHYEYIWSVYRND